MAVQTTTSAHSEIGSGGAGREGGNCPCADRVLSETQRRLATAVAHGGEILKCGHLTPPLPPLPASPTSRFGTAGEEHTHRFSWFRGRSWRREERDEMMKASDAVCLLCPASRLFWSPSHSSDFSSRKTATTAGQTRSETAVSLFIPFTVFFFVDFSLSSSTYFLCFFKKRFFFS